MNADRTLAEAWIACGFRNGTLVSLALVMTGLAGCSGSDPLLAPGEQALTGWYQLDDVLLAPGKLVILPSSNPLFGDRADTPEQAERQGLLDARQAAVLNRQDCGITILADHSFVITNLPSPDLTETFSLKGTWSMEVYHVFDSYGYRISLKCSGYKGPAIRAKFFNGDKPDPAVLEIFYGDGKRETVMFRVAKPKAQAGSPRPGAP